MKPPLTGLTCAAGAAFLILTAARVPAAEVIHLDVARQGDGYYLDALVRLAAPVSGVWAAMVDYERLESVSEAITESTVLATLSPAVHRVHSLTRFCVLMFCRTMEHSQLMTQVRYGELTAEVEPENSDFEYGYMRWRFLPEGDATLLSFSGHFKPTFWVPPLIGPWVIQEAMVRATLETSAGLEREGRKRVP